MKSLCLVLLCVCLSACGFHLRGQHTLSAKLSPMSIERNHVDSALITQLKQSLKQNGVRVISTPEKAHAHLQLISANFSQSSAELGSNTQWRRHTLRFNIAFQLLDRRGKTILANDNVSVIRQFTENPNQLLGSDNERRTLRAEMRREAIERLMSRLQSQNRVQ